MKLTPTQRLARMRAKLKEPPKPRDPEEMIRLVKSMALGAAFGNLFADVLAGKLQLYDGRAEAFGEAVELCERLASAEALSALERSCYRKAAQAIRELACEEGPDDAL